MKRLTGWLSIALIAILVLSFLTGCGGESTKTTTAAATTGASTTTAGKVVVLRLTQAEPANDWMAVANQKLADEFNAKAVGYKIECYPGQTLVSISESMDAVRTGAVEMMDIGWGSIANVVPTFGACELPFLFNNIDANAAAQKPLFDILSKEFEAKLNQKALASYNIGALELISTKPIKTQADWKGLLTQAISPQCTALIEGLGGAASAIPFPECYSGLQKGTIDASLQGPAFMEVGKLYEPAKYATFGYLLPSSHGWTINLDVWNKMPKVNQDLLLDLTSKTAVTQTAAAKVIYTDLQTKLNKDYGVEVYIVPAAERAKWAAALQPYVQAQLDKMGDNGKKVKEIAADVNAQFPNN